jgi:hypothetical protein
MGLPRSTVYDPAPAALDAGEILSRIGAICDEFECYGYRRVGAALRQQMASSGGRAPPSQNTPTPSAESHWPGAARGLRAPAP